MKYTYHRCPADIKTDNWSDFVEMRDWLANDGWLTPNTYSGNFAEFGNFPAVYLFLAVEDYYFERARVAYVGMSKSLISRMCGHEIFPEVKANGVWVMRWFKPIEVKALRSVERRYIQKFNPPFNIIGKERGGGFL